MGAVTLTKVGEYSFAVNGCGGITYAGGNTFYVLRDHDDSGKAAIYPLTLGYNATTGAITSPSLGTPVNPTGLGDSEGIAFDPGAGTLWISDEATPTIREFYPYGMATTRPAAPIPSVQCTQKRSNRSLEALTISGDGLTMWTVNEQALTCDGEASDGTTSVKTVVRLTKFSRPTVSGDWVLAGSWAYACDACAGTISSQSGLSGLCALPDGSLLTLEREVSIATSGRCTIYRVTPEALANATEISSMAALTDATYSAVAKGKALVSFNNSAESGFLTYNMIVYEGICLGPRLSGGDLAVYLVSDGGETKKQSIATAYTLPRLCALRLSGLNVRTVDLAAPTTCDQPSLVGTNYRYLDGAEINVTLEGEGLSPVAYTNRGARVADVHWSLSDGRTGTGTTASFTVTNDVRLAWEVVESTAITPILADDSFEGVDAGTQVADLSGWTGTGSVVAAAYPVPAVGVPMQRATHTQVLSVDEVVARTYAVATTNVKQQLDMMVKVVHPTDADVVALEGHQAYVMVFPDGRFHVGSAAADGSALDSIASDTVYAEGSWVRLSLAFDYDRDEPCFTVRLDGAYCGCYRCYGAKQKLERLNVLGNTQIDDVLFTDGEPQFELVADAASTVLKGITIPQTWLDRYGQRWNDTECDDDGDGLKQWQEYLAGTSPTNATSVFAIADFKMEGHDVTITFTGELPRPDLLKLKWCTDLGGAQTVLDGEVTTEGGVSVWRATAPAEARFFRAELETK